ncbi:MAG: hypothetical protein HDT25_05945 [Ruminococcus sp.]|nr:hypothetical protein [Ruminococcus sp.]
MHYIIIAIIVIALIVFLLKHVLFNPRINSVLNIVGFIALIVLSWNTPYRSAVIIFAIAIIDCIRDIVLAEDLYEDIEISIDPLYAIKSILSILTLGLIRVIFLLIFVPCVSLAASSAINRKLKSGYPFIEESSRGSNYSYFEERKIDKLKARGKIVSNEETLKSEMRKSRARLDKLYPEKFVGKVIDVVAGDKDMKKRRKDAESRINNSGGAYISKETFEKYPQALIEAMSQRSVCSPSDIKDFEELRSFHFNEQCAGDGQKWAVYFIIQALQPLVEIGEFTDDILNDNDVLDNHAYQYVRSNVQMASIDGDNDPRLALDDDD